MFSDMLASTLSSLVSKWDSNKQIDDRKHAQPRFSMDVTKLTIRHPLNKVSWSMTFRKLQRRKLNAKTMEKIYARSTFNSEQTLKVNKFNKRLVEILIPLFQLKVWAHLNQAFKFLIKVLQVVLKELLASKVATSGVTECIKSLPRKMVRQLHHSLRTTKRKEWWAAPLIKDQLILLRDVHKTPQSTRHKQVTLTSLSL